MNVDINIKVVSEESPEDEADHVKVVKGIEVPEENSEEERRAN